MRRSITFSLALLTVACGSADITPEGPQSPGPPAGGAHVSFSINSGSRQAISPYIYGRNQVDWVGRPSHLKLGRLGGNRWTAYNWETNASNAGSDFRNQNDNFLGGGDTPGEAVRSTVAAAHAAGASMLVTVPIAGYVAADKAGDGDVGNSPDYLNTRFHQSLPSGGGRGYPPNTGDSVVYQDQFVAWLESTFPESRSDASRTLFYSLDNEPDLWVATHSRIRPNGPVTYDEMLQRTIAYASAIKSMAPGALVFGPASYGWEGYVSLQDAPDAGGRDFLDFYLDTLRQQEGSHGRLVDVLDVHWYPEAKGGGVRITDANASAAVAAARVQAPRSLWDPSYVETSWISQDAGVGAIRLIPRLQEKIAAHYPGTRLAISEYNYGAGGDISGGVAQADVLGVFGREGLFAATEWDLQSSSPFIDAAFSAFCNFDGSGGRFGDTSIPATTSNGADTSIYASLDSGREDRMVVVVVNKAQSGVTADIAISHGVSFGTLRTFRLTSSSAALASQSSPAISGNSFHLDMAASSVYVVELLR
jgi:hypothetical protein